MKNKKVKVKIYDVNESNDVKFKGLFSYRHLRVFGWAALALGSIGIVLGTFANVNQQTGYQVTSTIFNIFNSVMAPLFIFACFAQVLTAKNGYRNLIMLYVGAAIGIFLAFLIGYQHFLVGILSATGTEDATQNADRIISLFAPKGFIVFNVFVDLALCSLLTFFLNYHPKRFFQGKLIYIFRSFAILPILYEVASLVLKILATQSVIKIPTLVFPLLTTKPLVSFIIFIALAFFVKIREIKFLKNGKTLDDYKAFLDTNTNRKHVSRYLILWVVIAVVLDVIIYVVATIFVYYGTYYINDSEANVLMAVGDVRSWGIGTCVPMLLIIPILFFFDYRKTYDDKIIDKLIPLAGVAVVLIIYVEGFFQFARYYLSRIRNAVNSIVSSDEEPSSVPIRIIANVIHKIIK